MMSTRTNNPHLQEFKTWKIVSQVFCCLRMDSILGVNPKWIVAALHTLELFLDNSTLFYSISASNKLFLLATSTLYNILSRGTPFMLTLTPTGVTVPLLAGDGRTLNLMPETVQSSGEDGAHFTLAESF
jgi:hypothetical protein